MHFAQKAATEFQVQGLSLSSRSFFQFPFPVVSRESLTVSPSNMDGALQPRKCQCACVCVCVGVEKSLFLPCLVFIAAHGLFSSCGKRELFSSCGPHRFVAYGLFPDQGLNLCPCVDRWILNHGATREVTMSLSLYLLPHFLFSHFDKALTAHQANKCLPKGTSSKDAPWLLKTLQPHGPSSFGSCQPVPPLRLCMRCSALLFEWHLCPIFQVSAQMSPPQKGLP